MDQISNENLKDSNFYRFFSDNMISAGRGFYFPGDSLDLGCGRELLKGFYMSTRIVDGWKITLNLNSTKYLKILETYKLKFMLMFKLFLNVN